MVKDCIRLVRPRAHFMSRMAMFINMHGVPRFLNRGVVVHRSGIRVYRLVSRVASSTLLGLCCRRRLQGIILTLPPLASPLASLACDSAACH